ncbi:MAG TPA: hypothetical protein VH575_01400 [Gemmataceae bacterium]|jgi:hypothetical protein
MVNSSFQVRFGLQSAPDPQGRTPLGKWKVSVARTPMAHDTSIRYATREIIPAKKIDGVEKGKIERLAAKDFMLACGAFSA